MKLSELGRMIAKLYAEHGDIEVMILSGLPLDINGVSTHVITERDADDAADCEERVGEKVIVLQCGSY